MLKHFQPLGRVQVVADFAENDQVELTRRPVAWQATLFDPNVGPGPQTLGSQLHRRGIEVLAQQALGAFGEPGAEFAIGAGRFEHARVVLAWQAGQ
ncbi:hypothetical protein D3C77_460980 [compost metagenome]